MSRYLYYRRFYCFSSTTHDYCLCVCVCLLHFRFPGYSLLLQPPQYSVQSVITMMTNELDAAQNATSGFGSIQVRLAKAGRICDQLLRDIVKNRVWVLNPQQQSEFGSPALFEIFTKKY